MINLLKTMLSLSYQSECHCAKTHCFPSSLQYALSYQSECHCAKTRLKALMKA